MREHHEAVLVDLDGPLTRLLPDPQHLELANRLADEASRRGGSGVVADLSPAATRDHVQLLRELAATHPDLAAEVLPLATEAELAAAHLATPAPGAAEFLAAARAAGLGIAVVSNNDQAAVTAALEACGLAEYVDFVSARRADALESLKPAPDLLMLAMAALNVRSATMFGDTPSDVLAAHAAGIPAVGVTADHGQAELLRDAGAEIVVEHLDPADLSRGLR